MSNYIRRCSLELLAFYYSNTDFEDEFQSLLKLVQEPESIQIVANLAQDEVLTETLHLIDKRVEAKLVYDENRSPGDSVFDDVITEELATRFLYRLVKLS